MARFTAASISGSERSTRLRKWNRLVLARFTAVEATIDRPKMPLPRLQSSGGAEEIILICYTSFAQSGAGDNRLCLYFRPRWIEQNVCNHNYNECTSGVVRLLKVLLKTCVTAMQACCRGTLLAQHDFVIFAHP